MLGNSDKVSELADEDIPAMTPQQAKFSGSGKSGFGLYRELAVGKSSLAYFIYYEFCTFCLSGLAGLVGYGLRALFYPGLFKSCGARPAFGRGVVLRNPLRISIGQKVLIDDYSVMNVRADKGSITVGDHVGIGRFTSLISRGGDIILHSGSNIGAYCRIGTETRVEIGSSVLIAAYVYIGPGNHQLGDIETPLIAKAMEVRGGVKIEQNAWIGSKAIILDGVTIGQGAIVGAHSLVREDVPPYTVVAGIPAKVIKVLPPSARTGQQSPSE